MSAIPDEGACEALLAEAGADEGVFAHVRAVRRRAEAIARTIAGQGHTVRLDVVVAGALLHDVGRAFTGGATHGAVGADWLRERGCPEAVALCVERHILAGLGTDECAAAGLDRQDLIPRSLEEKIVAHADNLTGDDGPRDIEMLLDNLPADSAITRRVEELHRELTRLAGGSL